MNRIRARVQRGQAMVEFSLGILVFLVLVMGIFDFGRAIYQYNGVSEAAREIARVTAAHAGTDFTTIAGQSPQTRGVIATQMSMIPNLEEPTITCVQIDGTLDPDHCAMGEWIRVEIHAPYRPITPLLGLATAGLDLFSSSTSVQLSNDK